MGEAARLCAGREGAGRALSLTPNSTLDDAARRRGLRAYQADGVCSQVRDALLSGPLLVGYALLLGASHTQVGLLAALGPATQVLQLPTVALIERWRKRKAICWWAALVGRTASLGLLALPWAVASSARVPALFGLLLVMAVFATISGAAWNPWIRDFLPDEGRNRVVARRMTIATAIGAPLALGAGIAIDRLRGVLGAPAEAQRRSHHPRHGSFASLRMTNSRRPPTVRPSDRPTV